MAWRWANSPPDSRRDAGATVRSKQFGNDSKTSERRRRVTPGEAEETEIFHAQAQPLQVLRTSARVPAQVRHLPLVLPAACAARGDSRGFEVVVVTSAPGSFGGKSSRLRMTTIETM